MSNHFLKSDIMIHNNIPQGYKDSALGIIPQEWEVKYLEEVCSIKGGFAFDSKTFLPSGTYQIIKMSNLYNGNLDLSRSSSFIDKLPRAANDSILNAGDILITLTGTVGKKDYGYTYLITDETNLLLNQRVAKLVPHNICPEFIYPTLKTQRFLTPFFYSSRGGTGNQTNVSTKDILDIPILYPPKAEQEKIAEILGVWDSAIEKQSALVDALTRRKRALMQQLLTAKKRLPNFTEPWQTVILEKVLERLSNGLTYNTELKIGIPVTRIETISAGVINFDKIGYADNNTNTNVELYKLQKGDILFSHINSLAHIGKVAIYNDCRELYHGMNLLLMRYNNLVSSKYLYYFLCSNVANKQMKSMAKQAVNQASINIKELSNWKFLLPSIPEQQAIAKILSTADQEIELAKKRLKAFRTQKSALMQQLLTGKKRVVI